MTPELERGHLPAPLTSLVGRDEELGRLDELFGRARLLTVAGTGGCGKTRLALAAAERRRADYPDGAWWVDLSATSGRELPVQAIVRAGLGIPQSADDSTLTLARHLHARRTLLVLDNCEHVATECAALIELLLQHAPGLTVLATSREVLGVPGEHVFRLGGLRLPVSEAPAGSSEAPGGSSEALAGSSEALAGSSEAVRLFVERARSVCPEFELGPSDVPTVNRLCRQLDGLPLAIELAAARVGLLSVQEITERLEHDVGLLRHPSRTAPARQQTLVATLDWSHGLLDSDEQVLFRRLACFRGSFSLLAAETVTAGNGLAGPQVLDLIAALVDKSLLQVAHRGREHRHRMLETVRQYGEAQLAASGDDQTVRSAHAEFYLELALHARAGLDGPDQVRWLDRIEIEIDNVRTALEWSLVQAAETGCRLAAALWPFWYRRGHYNEGRYWLEGALQSAPGTAPAVQAATLTAAGILAFFQCEYGVARDRLSRARVLHEEAGDRLGLATVLLRLGGIAREEARYGDARPMHEASLAIYAELGDEVGVAINEDQLGFAAWLEGDAELAIRLCSRAVDTLRLHGRNQETAAALVDLGAACWLAGESERAESLLRESLAISEGISYPEGEAWSLHELAVVLAERDPSAARPMLARSLRGHAELGDRWRVASVLETIAHLASASQVPADRCDPLVVANLLGAAIAIREQLGTPTPPSEGARCEAALAFVQSMLGAAGTTEGLEAGRRLSIDRAVGLALATLAPGASPPLPPPEPPAAPVESRGLTERELDVLRLLARGLTNREIGAELFISAGTAGVHVSNILRKLGVGGRVQAAGIAHQMGLDIG